MMKGAGFYSILLGLLILLLPGTPHAQDASILGRISVGKDIDLLALVPDTGIAYGINSGSKTLYILDLKTYSVKKKLTLERRPLALSVNPSNNYAYITSIDAGNEGLLSIVDSEGNISRIGIVEDPHGIVVDQQRNRAVIAIEKDKKLLIISTEDYSVGGEISLPHRPNLIALDLDSNRAVVVAGKANGEGKQNQLLIVNLSTGAVDNIIETRKEMSSLAVDGKLDVAVTIAGEDINIIDINTGHVLSTVEVESAHSIDINPSTHIAVISGEKGLTLLDLTGQMPTRYLTVDGHGPVAVDSYKNTALVGVNDGAIEIQLPNPVPVITRLDPKSSRVGEPGFNLAVEGIGFITVSSVLFENTKLETVFKNNEELEAKVPSALITSPGTVLVTVKNPEPAGGVSAPYPFIVRYPIPVLNSISPATITARAPDFTLKAEGTNFMPGYLLNFNGQDLATTYINASELDGSVPSSSISSKGVFPVVVITPERQNSNFLSFTVIDPYPIISDFTPKEGLVGTVVTIQGNNFGYTPTTVTFGGVSATTQISGQNQITATVPAGAVTGPIVVSTATGIATSSTNFTVLKLQDFELNVDPQSISIPSTGSASAVVSFQSTGINPFTGLVKLSAGNLPAGMAAAFKPEYISAGQTSILTITLTSSLTSQMTLNVNGSAVIEGRETIKTANLVLNPIQAGTTTLSGQILATKDAMPIASVTLVIGSSTLQTDSAGNFLFIDPPVGSQVLMINGDTANHAGITYPSAIPAAVNIEGGKDNTLSYPIYLHEAKTDYFTVIDPSRDTIVTDPEISNYEMLIPAGVVIIGLDGKPNEKVSVKPVPIDRLPINPPPAGIFAREIYMYYFFKPGGGNPSQPISVKMPNVMQASPGERVQLWYYDESQTPDPNSNQWKTFGLGTVSDDGRNILPDPGVGIPKFCCGASFWSHQPPDNTPPGPPCNSGQCCFGAGPGGGGAPGDPGSSGNPTTLGDPVDAYSGMFVYSKHDIGYPSPSLAGIQRFYNSGNSSIGQFGQGTNIGYDYYLRGSGNALTYMTPNGGRYILSKNADGSYTNGSYPFLMGSKAYLNADNTRTLQLRDGRTNTFNSDGRLIRESDRNGNWVQIARDFLGNVTGISDSFGRILAFANTFIRVPVDLNRTFGYYVTSAVSDNMGREVLYTYDGLARLTSVTMPDGATTRYTYVPSQFSSTQSGRIQSITNPNGTVEVTNELDAAGRVIRQTHADGAVFTIVYTVVGGAVTSTQVTDAQGKKTAYRFNNAGYVIEITDAFGQKTTEDRAFGTNVLRSVTDPLGRKVSATIDANGNRISYTDAGGNTTYYEYDPALNLPTKITDALGSITAMTYDTKGNKTSVTDPSGKTIRMTYNNYGKPVSITDALNNTTTLEYNGYGDLIKTTDALGNSMQMDRDLIGRLTVSTDSNGRATTYSYDGMNRLTEVIDALGNITKYAYNSNGNLASITDAKNHAISYTYNLRNKIATMTDQLGRVETYSYDGNDNLTSVTDRKGLTAAYTYDLMNRVTRVDYADGSYVTYAYDAGGRLLSITDSVSGTITYTYTGTGCGSGCSMAPDKVASETTALGTISYTYDSIGRRMSMLVSGQPVVNYGYDAGGRLNDVNTMIGGVTKHFVITYDNLGRRSSLTMPNGVTTNYSYDNGSHLLNMDHRNPGNQVLESLAYTYDATGNRISMNRPTMTLPLPGAVNSTNHNEANQMLTFAPVTGTAKNLIYDNNGNMTAVTNSCGTTHYTWDVRNRMTGISGYKADCSSLTASFQYDALGRRISKAINGVTTQYLYDGKDIVQEIEDGAPTVNYIRTMNIDEPLTKVKADGTGRYYQADALGSVLALTDGTGTVKTQYSYDPFGNTTTTGEASDNPFQYTGRENDNTSLYYYRARYYSPELQRFISEDPILQYANPSIPFKLLQHLKDPAILNAYQYTENNPLKYTDPEGLFPWGGAVAGAAVCGYGYCLYWHAECMQDCTGRDLRNPNINLPPVSNVAYCQNWCQQNSPWYCSWLSLIY